MFKQKSKRKSKRFAFRDRLEDLLASHEEQLEKLKDKQAHELHELWIESYKVNRKDPICQELWIIYCETVGGPDYRPPMPSISFR